MRLLCWLVIKCNLLSDWLSWYQDDVSDVIDKARKGLLHSESDEGCAEKLNLPEQNSEKVCQVLPLIYKRWQRYLCQTFWLQEEWAVLFLIASDSLGYIMMLNTPELRQISCSESNHLTNLCFCFQGIWFKSFDSESRLGVISKLICLNSGISCDCDASHSLRNMTQVSINEPRWIAVTFWSCCSKIPKIYDNMYNIIWIII